MAKKTSDGTYYVPGLAEQSPQPTKTTSDVKPWLSGKSIIVAGGGMSGLSFAIALTKNFPTNHPPPTLTIYERDSYDDRVGREGYTLSLRTDARSGGVQALDKLGLYEKVKAVSVTHAGSMHVWHRDFSNSLVRVSVQPLGEKGLTAMRIRRNALQKAMADKVEECGYKIVWSTAVVNAHKRVEGGMRVELSDGKSVDCDLLLAADGSSSKIRAALRPKDTLDFTGVVMLGAVGKFKSEEDVPRPVNSDWGLMLGGGGTGLFVSPVEKDSALYGFSYYAKEPRPSLRHPIPEDKAAELMEEARTLAKKFDPKVMELVNATELSTLMAFSAMDRPPFPHTPAKDGPVVWMGDANHAVSPFAGNGANMAIIDGWDLAQALSQAETLEGGLTEYDKKFIPRAKVTLKASRWAIDVAHATGLKLWLYTLVVAVMRFIFVREKA